MWIKEVAEEMENVFLIANSFLERSAIYYIDGLSRLRLTQICPTCSAPFPKPVKLQTEGIFIFLVY